MTETVRDFITLCLKETGVIGVGQTPLPDDINDSFTILNRMLSQWQRRRWIVPSLYEIAALGNGNQFNLIGPGQYYNATRPDKIQAAYFVQAGAGFSGPNEVSYSLIWMPSWEDYAQVQLKQLPSWPQYFFYDNSYPFGRVYIWPIPDATYEIHLILKSPIGFTTKIANGAISVPGGGYTAGAYPATPLQSLSGFGSGATADITVAGGVVTVLGLDNGGDGYNINDNIGVNPADVGGTGAGFVWNVQGVTDTLDSKFNMPPEYEEAIHYNLCVRLTSMYQYPANPVQGQLAKLALNTIKNANAQIPLLRMPPALRFNRGNQFYIFSADAR